MAKLKNPTPTRDFVLPQGEDYRFQIQLLDGDGSSEEKPIDITGYTFTCEVREDATDDSPVLTAESHIIDPAQGIVEIHFKADDTDAVDVDGPYYGNYNQYTYDVFKKDADGDESRILCGYVYISPSVSNR